MKLFYSMQYKYSDLHEIYLVFLLQFNTLASEVKCLRVIERRDLSNEQNTFKSKTIFYHNKTRLKPERATRPIPKRRRPLYATATTQILNLSNLLKGSDIKRTSRRTALLKGRNTRTIQLPLRHLKGIGIGMTPLSDWLNVLPRGSGIAYVMACCIALALKSYRKMCMQHVYSTHVRKGSAQNHSLHMYSMHGDPTVVYSTCSPFSFVTCLLNIGGVILNLMYKKASLSDVLRLQLCMSTATISFSHIATPCMNPNLMH